MTSIDEDVIAQFRSQLRGEVLGPGDPGYDSARAVWNAMIDRRPRLIARCRGVTDVRRALGFAREHRLPLSIKGGGHHIAGNAVCDDGLVLDLSGMKAVHVDPEARRASAEPGATLADFDHETQAFGLATPLGINSTTGIAGLTLGGGFGWLTRKYGMSVDNLIGAEVVLADGSRVRASTQEHPDLFWAIRGGGGNFGVVTRFEFQLHPVGPELLSGLIVFPFAEARTVLKKYRALVEQMPEELNVWVVLRKAPPLPFLPAAVHGTPVVVLPLLYVGETEAGRKAIEPLRALGSILGEHVGPQPYTAWQRAFDALLTPGARNYWKSHNFTELSDGAIDVLVEYAGTLPSAQCEIFVGLVAGQANRVAKDATAYPHRDARFVVNVHSRWETFDDDAPCIRWARDFFARSAPYATGGAYVNFLTQDETDRVAAAYGPNHARLAQVKRRYDPENVFCLNQNIKPAPQAQARAA